LSAEIGQFVKVNVVLRFAKPNQIGFARNALSLDGFGTWSQRAGRHEVGCSGSAIFDSSGASLAPAVASLAEGFGGELNSGCAQLTRNLCVRNALCERSVYSRHQGPKDSPSMAAR